MSTLGASALVCALYRTSTEEKYTPWFETEEQVVDFLAEQGAVAAKVYERQGGDMFVRTAVGRVPIEVFADLFAPEGEA